MNMRNDKETACYTGYILKALADAKKNLGDVKRYNIFTDFMDTETRRRLAEIYCALDTLLNKCMDDAGVFGAIISPNQELDWDTIYKNSKIGKRSE